MSWSYRLTKPVPSIGWRVPSSDMTLRAARLSLQSRPLRLTQSSRRSGSYYYLIRIWPSDSVSATVSTAVSHGPLRVLIVVRSIGSLFGGLNIGESIAQHPQKSGPDYSSNRIFGGGGGTGVARAGMTIPESVVQMNAFDGAVDDGFEFAKILYFAASGEAALGFFRTDPSRVTIAFVGTAHLMDLHEEGLDHEFLHSTGLPEYALGMDVEVEVTRLDGADRTGFFGGFALGGLAVREARVSRPLGECPLVAAVGIHQEELDRVAAPAITDRSHLKRQGLRDAG